MGHTRYLAASSLIALCSSCASIPTRGPAVPLPPQRFTVKGASLVPLDESGWMIINKSSRYLRLGKYAEHSDGAYAIEAWVLEIQRTFNSEEELRQRVKNGAAVRFEPRRYTILSQDISSYEAKGKYCALEIGVAEDHEASQAFGRSGDMIYEWIQLYCVHPENNRVAVEVEFSQSTLVQIRFTRSSGDA